MSVLGSIVTTACKPLKQVPLHNIFVHNFTVDFCNKFLAQCSFYGQLIPVRKFLYHESIKTNVKSSHKTVVCTAPIMLHH